MFCTSLLGTKGHAGAQNASADVRATDEPARDRLGLALLPDPPPLLRPPPLLPNEELAGGEYDDRAITAATAATACSAARFSAR
ncbi:hypothetical protein BRAS3843_1820005 [Bradyrhizobium sp. STM 3843]|nr:hypothetical protein BRAS3843_1820005 [Bradyrhizobium sp. STM 3843]